MDFNTAEPQRDYRLIPKGIIAKVRMMIKRGGFNDPTLGWTGDYATRNNATGAVYLNCEFFVLEGPYAKQKVWSLIGLHSAKGPEWGHMGRAFMRAILNSARGFTDKDQSLEAVAARNANFADFDGIEFLARIDMERDKRKEEERNVIKMAILKDHKDYLGNASCSDSAPAPSSVAPSWAR